MFDSTPRRPLSSCVMKSLLMSPIYYRTQRRDSRTPSGVIDVLCKGDLLLIRGKTVVGNERGTEVGRRKGGGGGVGV